MKNRRTGKIKRKSSRREPKARFTLFCEGENTEPTYFTAIKKVQTGALIKIDSRGGEGTPITIAKNAIKFAGNEGLLKSSRRRKNLFEEGDKVWAVFDRDEHEWFEEAVTLCEKNGIGVARSNPCFELWLILHETDYDRPDDHHAVQRELARLRSDYDKQRKIPNCEEMVNRLPQAERRSEEQLRRREREGMPYGPPSTTVGDLTKAIREADERIRRGK